MKSSRIAFLALLAFALIQGHAQPYGEPDRGQPGDPMIQNYLQRAAAQLDADFLAGITTAADWNTLRPKYREEYLHMLGLWPLPEKTPLRATVTRTLARGDYTVEMLHYQSRPGLYVTANLYRPAALEAGQRCPAVLYVCGHSGRGRDGNKTAFQSHGIWFARHGYVCLVVDTLQLGEISGVHHGTYREERWWWLSAGYTPAGVECWNGVRGIDYLVSRPDVDPERIAVTGISGGGAATFWIAAADDRVKVAVPVSGMADLVSYVSQRVVNGHCDCMFLYNAYQWPWTRIAALIAPRPILFVNSDQDPIFPMDANERVINRLERLYSVFGKGDLVDSVVSIGGHAYRQDIREAAYRFINTHLKNDPSPVLDSEVDLVRGAREEIHPIPPEQLRVFAQDTDIPADALNGRIDEEFVPRAKGSLPPNGNFEGWRNALVARLRTETFNHFPERIPPARPINTAKSAAEEQQLETENGIRIRLKRVFEPTDKAQCVILWVTKSGMEAAPPDWVVEARNAQNAVYACEPRGTGATQWTRRNPPNYVERSHYLLGRTADSGRIWDVVASARYLKALHKDRLEIRLAGETESAVLAIYAALLDQEIDGLVLKEVPASHRDDRAPALLNVLRVCDVSEALGMVAPRPVILNGSAREFGAKVQEIYKAAGALGKLTVETPK